MGKGSIPIFSARDFVAERAELGADCRLRQLAGLRRSALRRFTDRAEIAGKLRHAVALQRRNRPLDGLDIAHVEVQRERRELL